MVTSYIVNDIGPGQCTFTLRAQELKSYPLRATMHLAPLVGSLRKAKSRDGSHISVRVFGRYPPTECVRLLPICMDLRLRLELKDSLIRQERFNRMEAKK